MISVSEGINNMSPQKFSDEENEKLLERIASHPSL